MTGIEIAPRPRKRQPLKHKLRYSTAVTVCIAVACQENGKPRIVMCSDSRLDYGDLGSTNTTCKSDVLGHGWCAQMGGHWSGVKELCAILKRRVQKFPSALRSSDMAMAAQKSVAEFAKSPLYQSDQGVQLLVSGFDAQTATIFDISVYPNKVTIDSSDEFGAIGSGSVIASTLLRLRECHRAFPLSYAVYIAYEAKRASEKCGDVGVFTALSIQAPPSYDDKERAWLRIMSGQGKANLEVVYQGLWKVPFVKFPDLPGNSFIDPTKKQSPE